MAKYKIIIFAKGEAPRQAENLKWYPVLWFKFKVPKLNYEDRIEIEKGKFNWSKVKQLIKGKVKRHKDKVFTRIEYEEDI